MLIEPQCIFLVRSVIGLFGDFGDQSVVVWEKHEGRGEVSLSEIGMNERNFVDTIKTLDFVKEREKDNIIQYCSKLYNQKMSGRFRAPANKDAYLKKAQEAEVKFKGWKKKSDGDRISFFTRQKLPGHYSNCLKLYDGRSLEDAMIGSCGMQQLVQGIIAKHVALTGYDCAAPRDQEFYFVHSKNGLKLQLTGPPLKYTFIDDTHRFIPLAGKVLEIVTNKNTGLSYIAVEGKSTSMGNDIQASYLRLKSHLTSDAKFMFGVVESQPIDTVMIAGKDHTPIIG
ncbi:hypothetical protein GcM1_183021 [Golovinomyces cichoracearum]|uniref:Uncharacterized protein n=1 Tax=Golovinomyces cichoracearum TaxID=62708 RepID=A0A420J3J8_9PEZI|nr:hypothetical protein GcM1_183021 [Golovinomyces cichoracearum]